MYTRSINFDADIDSAALPNHLADCLRGVDARDIEIKPERVTFTGGVLRLVNNWNVLVPFGFGELIIDHSSRRVIYRLSFRQLMVGVTALVGLLAVFVFSISLGLRSSQPRSWQPIEFLPFMWIWLVGGNLLIGIPRFRSFLSRAISTAPKRK